MATEAYQRLAHFIRSTYGGFETDEDPEPNIVPILVKPAKTLRHLAGKVRPIMLLLNPFLSTFWMAVDKGVSP